jgi:aryl-alcohol dehydrogenase-like predicted oxidoreductase
VDRNSGGIPVRPFGNTDVKVSAIGLGGGHICRDMDVAASVRLVQTAIDAGITFLDNAWEYADGECESRVGKAIAEGGRREKIFLMTKVCSRDRKGAEEQLHDSLKRLRTDVIDLWQFHECNYDNDAEWIFGPAGVMEAARAARQAGKIRFIGFTGHKTPHIHRQMLEQEFDWDACQLPITVMDAHYRSFQKEVLPELNRRGIAAIGMKSLGGLGQFVTAAGLSPGECRRYALSLPISTLVVGIDSMERLEQELEIARAFVPMGEDERSSLLAKVRPQATAGRHEWYKSTQHFDSKTHRDQHSFPPVAGEG